MELSQSLLLVFWADSAATKYLEEVDKDHDDVEVEDKSSHNEVVDAELVPLATHHKLSVKDQVNPKQENTKAGKTHLSKCVAEEKAE